MCDDYLVGYVECYCVLKGVKEIWWMFDMMFKLIVYMFFEQVIWFVVFDLINLYVYIFIQVGKFCIELGVVWMYGYDFGWLGEGVLNWWCEVMCGCFCSVG